MDEDALREGAAASGGMAYERLLAAPVRKAHGVYETPPALARWLASAAGVLCRRELGLSGGLADPQVAVLDPAAGSGAMLLAALEEAPGGRVAGIELLPGACRLAGLRLRAAGGPERAVQQGDALDLDPARAQELMARLVGPRALVVLGNPPYSAAREAPGARFTDRLAQRYLVPDRKAGVLRDRYVRFTALVEWLVCEVAGAGVAALVLNHSFLEGPAHRGMRAHLARSFDAIWVVDLGGNVRRGQRGPMFDAQIGIALMVALRRPAEGPRRAVVRTFALEGGREEKMRWLGEHGLSDVPWRGIAVPVPAPGLCLPELRSPTAASQPAREGALPAQGELRSPPVPATAPWLPAPHPSSWDRWPSLPEILPAHSEGIQTNRDALAIAFTRDELLDQVARFAAGGPGGRDSAHWTAARARAALLAGGGVRKELARPYLYRPFDVRWIYAHPALVHRLRPGLGPLWRGEAPALVATRQTRGEPFAHIAAAWLPADNCLLSVRPSNRAKLFPLAGPALETGAWALAIMSAPGWQALAAERARADWPRLPLPAGGALFEAGVALGHKLLDLWRTPPPPTSPGRETLGGHPPADRHRVGGHQPLTSWRRARSGRGLHPAELAAHRSAAAALQRMADLRQDLDRLWAQARAL